MAGMIVIGICNICKKEVEEKDFSQECYKIYRNVTHKGDCYKTFKENAEQFEKTKKRTVMERLAELEERMDKLEGKTIGGGLH